MYKTDIVDNIKDKIKFINLYTRFAHVLSSLLGNDHIIPRTSTTSVAMFMLFIIV